MRATGPGPLRMLIGSFLALILLGTALLKLPAATLRVLAVGDALTQKVQVNPGADFRVKDSDALLLLGRNEDLARLKQG